MSKFIWVLINIFMIIIILLLILGIRKIVSDKQREVCINNGGKVISNTLCYFDRCFYE